MSIRPRALPACRRWFMSRLLLEHAPGHQASTSAGPDPWDYSAIYRGFLGFLDLHTTIAGRFREINVNQPTPTQGFTPLYMFAAQEGFETCVRQLLGAPGINVN